MKKKNYSETFPITVFCDENDHVLSYPVEESSFTEKLNALLVKPGMHPQRVTINNDYESLTAVIADHLDFISPFTDNAITIIINALGKIDGSEANRVLKVQGKMVDVICGNFLVVGDDAKNGDFCSLTKKQFEKFEKMFFTPQIFAYRDEQLIAVPIPEYLVIKP